MVANRRHIWKRHNSNPPWRRTRVFSDSASDRSSLETESLDAISESQDSHAIDTPIEHHALHESSENGEGGGGSDGFGHHTLIRDSSIAADDLASSPHQCYRYQPDVGNLSSSQKVALAALRQWLARESVDLTPVVGNGRRCPPEHEDLAFLRFLRRNGWDVEKTQEELKANLSWRIENHVAAALRAEPWEVSGCASEKKFDNLCKSYYPHYVLGSDRNGRPVLVQKYGNFNASKLRECTTIDALLRYHAWEQEKNAELLRRATARTGRLVETYTIIMDFKGMGISMVNRDFLRLMKELFDIDRKYYPARGGSTYIINTPPLFGLVWRGIRGFVEATQASIHIISKEEKWKAALAEAVDPSILPVEYGGSASSLDNTAFLPAVHRMLDRESMAAAAATSGSPTDEDTKRSVKASVDETRDSAIASSASSIARQFSLRGTRYDVSAGSSGGGGSPLVVLGGASSTDGVKSSVAIAGGGSPSRNGASGRCSGDVLQDSSEHSAVEAVANWVAKYRDSEDPLDDGRAEEGRTERISLSGWILGVIPCGRLAATVVATATSVTLGASLGAMGLAAGLAEAVVPEQMWAEAVNAFHTSQLMGRWTLGM